MTTSNSRRGPAIRRHRRQRRSDDVTARTTIIRADREDMNTSRLIDYKDELTDLAILADVIIPPPYVVTWLQQKVDSSSIIPQCIEAYTVNTVGTGWEVEPVVRGKEPNAGEACELATFVGYANTDQSLSCMMKEVVREREALGFSFVEVIRSGAGEIALLRHARARSIRLTPKHKDLVEVVQFICRGRRTHEVRERKRFRRYVQVIQGETVYFKEYGDPRAMNRNTGKYQYEKGYEAGADATEILHFKVPGPDVYGIPRWMAQLPNVLGVRESEELNFRYFRDNTVPPMMLTVSGGRLTQQSYRNLTELLHSENIGSARQHQIMLVEATGEGDSLDGRGSTVGLKVEKLADQRQSDANFQEYDEKSASKIRSCWRLPAIVVGNSKDSNFANAQISMHVVESQVFGPERDAMDEFLNRQLVLPPHGMNIKSCKLKGRVLSINSPETVMKTLTALNVIGAVTPRSAQVLANQMLQTELPAYPPVGAKGHEPWMDIPMTIYLRDQSKTHDEQSAKTPGIKEDEETGDIAPKRPENGSEGERL